MNDRQENKVSMYLAVFRVCESYNTDWAGNVAYANAVARLGDKFLLLKDIVEIQETPITGIRKDKLNAWEAMKDEALLVSGAVTAYATTINNQQLKDAVHFTATDLMRVRDTLAEERALVIHNQANAVVANLADYGVTALTLSNLMDRIIAFEALLVAPRVAIVDKKGATGLLKSLFDEVDSVLKNEMDPLMAVFKGSASVFYEAYFNARMIVDTGSSKPSVGIMITVKDAQTGAVLTGVDVSASMEGAPNKVYAAKVEPDGRLKVALPSSAVGDLANVNLRAVKEGYEHSFLTMAVLPRTNYDVVMLMSASAVPIEGA
jgi:hypothetical protein